MVALYLVWYNFCRIHKSLRVSQAMSANVLDRLWSMDDVAEMIEAMLTKPASVDRINSEPPRNNGDMQWLKIRRLNRSAATSFLEAGG